MKRLIAALLATSFISIPCLAVAPKEGLEKKQAHIVNRLYQITEGPVTRCQSATPAARQEFNAERKRFTKANKRLMTMMVESPFYANAKVQYGPKPIDPAKDTPESLAGECEYYSMLMRSLLDMEDGRKSTLEYEQLLSTPRP